MNGFFSKKTKLLVAPLMCCPGNRKQRTETSDAG